MTEAATGPKERTFIENARRQQIVAAAIDTIAEVGFAQASLARIAEPDRHQQRRHQLPLRR